MVQKIAVRSEFGAGLRQASSGNLTANPLVIGYLFRIRER